MLEDTTNAMLCCENRGEKKIFILFFGFSFQYLVEYDGDPEAAFSSTSTTRSLEKGETKARSPVLVHLGLPSFS